MLKTWQKVELIERFFDDSRNEVNETVHREYYIHKYRTHSILNEIYGRTTNTNVAQARYVIVEYSESEGRNGEIEVKTSAFQTVEDFERSLHYLDSLHGSGAIKTSFDLMNRDLNRASFAASTRSPILYSSFPPDREIEPKEWGNDVNSGYSNPYGKTFPYLSQAGSKRPWDYLEHESPHSFRRDQLRDYESRNDEMLLRDFYKLQRRDSR